MLFRRKTSIDSLESEVIIAKNESIIFSDKWSLSIGEVSVSVADNMHLNAAIDKFHTYIGMIESHEHMTQNFRHRWN